MNTTTFEQLWSEYEPIVHQVAYEFGGKARRYGADHDDFRQECTLWMLDNEAWLAEKREEIEDPDQFGKFLAKCLRNEASDYMLDIRDQAGGQPRRGAYWYTTGELKTLLPSMFNKDDWLNAPQGDGETRSTRSPAEGGNWLATLADVARAYDKLSKSDKDLLAWFHRDGESNKYLAEVYEITEATMSYRHTQALKRLQVHLGGERPKYMRDERDYPNDPWRGRHSISSSQMRAITNSYYEED